MNSSISVDNISSNISGRNTKEKISGETDEHYLLEKYLLRDRRGQDGKVAREVKWLEKKGRRSDLEEREGGGVGSKSLKNDVNDEPGSVRKVRRRGVGRVKEIVLTLEEGGE